MSLAALKRSHWILISLAIGLALGAIRQQSADDLQDRFGESINGQQHFEQMLTSSVEGQPAFEQIAVHAQWLADGNGGRKRQYIVAGAAFNGHPEDMGGKSAAKLYPSFFIADVPYRPKVNLSALAGPGRADLVARFQAISEPTVLDFLDVLSKSRGLSYSHSWWLEMGLVQWTIASFVVVGIIWPTIVNLLMFGSWRRPKELRGQSLIGVQAHTENPAKPDGVRQDNAQLDRMISELEENSMDLEPSSEKPAVATTAPVRQLTTAAAPALATADTTSRAEYGARKDDFYPTEVHVSKSSQSNGQL